MSPITLAPAVSKVTSSTPMQDDAIAADEITPTKSTQMPSTSQSNEMTAADDTITQSITPAVEGLAIMPQHQMFEVSSSYFNSIPERYPGTSNQPYMPKLLAKLSEDVPQEPVCNQIERPEAPTTNDFNSLKVHRGSISPPTELDDNF